MLARWEEAADDDEPEWDVDEIEQASLEVDETLIRWSMGLSIRGRLRAATRAARMLGRFRVRLLRQQDGSQ